MVHLLVVGALIQLLLNTYKPHLCAFLYTLYFLVLGLIGGIPMASLMIMCGIKFVASFIYFFLLNATEDSDGLWWTISVGGYFVLIFV